jgi:ABC-type multidrug transport system ATPase subunit
MSERLLVDEVHKRLGGRPVLVDVSFQCGAGSITVLAGPNGAGKSTLLRIVGGVLEPDRGVVEIDGQSVVGRRVRARARLGYVPEAADPPGHLSVDELLALVAALKHTTVPERAARERLGIAHLGSQGIDRLSLGERRRTCLAAALIGDPSVLVLDEPTNGLDLDGIALLEQLLGEARDTGTAILLATHDRDFAARLATSTLALDRGRLM